MRKDRLREIHTLSVIMSAEELFEAKGYDATSIDDIAYRTGISKSTLYVYFKSKQLICLPDSDFRTAGLDALKETCCQLHLLQRRCLMLFFA